MLARNVWRKKGAYHHTRTQGTHHTRTNEVKPHATHAPPRSFLNWIHDALMRYVRRNVLAKESDKKLQGTSTGSCRHTSSTGPRQSKNHVPFPVHPLSLTCASSRHFTHGSRKEAHVATCSDARESSPEDRAQKLSSQRTHITAFWCAEPPVPTTESKITTC